MTIGSTCSSLASGKSAFFEYCQTAIKRPTMLQDAKGVYRELERKINFQLTEYLLLGDEYHSIPFARRAMTCSLDRCLLAHRQLGIQTLRWTEDPFFAPWVAAAFMLIEIEDSFRAQIRTTEGLECTKKLTAVRKLMGVIDGQMEELHAGVAEVQRAEITVTDCHFDQDLLLVPDARIQNVMRERFSKRMVV